MGDPGASLTAASLDEIRTEARQIWAAAAAAGDRDGVVSTYRSHYRSRPELAASRSRHQGKPPRPASPHRRNKPHPSQLFLTCRLHRVADYNCSGCVAANEQDGVQGQAAAGGGDDCSGSCCSLSSDQKQAGAACRTATGRFAGSGGKAGTCGCRSCDSHPEGLVFQPTRIRGDFLIHPDWPPTLPHHSVP